jgi:hypothetical protein
VGLLDPESARPAATYPRDLFFDASNNLYLNRHFKMSPDWLPPQLWTPVRSDIIATSNPGGANDDRHD